MRGLAASNRSQRLQSQSGYRTPASDNVLACSSMAGALVPCGGCQRHVRTTEQSCPFCGAALTSIGGREPVAELRLLTRLDRGRMVALGAALSAAGIVLGCQQPAVAIYGGPPVPAPTPTPSATPTAPPPQMQPSEPAPATSVAEPAPSASAPPTPVVVKPKPAPTSKPTNPIPGAPAAAYGAPPKMPGPGDSGPVR